MITRDEGLPAPGRMELIKNIIRGNTPVPYSNMSVGELRNEPSHFDFFALYFPGQYVEYELISSSGSQLDLVASLREKILEAQLNPDSLKVYDTELSEAKANGTLEVVMSLREDKEMLGILGLPQLVLAFGNRVSDQSETALAFYPAYADPSESLEGLKQTLQSVIQNEQF